MVAFYDCLPQNTHSLSISQTINYLKLFS